MEPPIPTPYDIAEIPYIPWTPLGKHWLLLVLCCVILYLFGRLLVGLRGHGGATRSPFDLTRLTILSCTVDDPSAPLTKSQSSDLSNAIKRYLEFRFARSYRSLTGERLLDSDEHSPDVKALLSIVARADKHRYAPDNAETLTSGEASRIIEHLEAVESGFTEKKA